MEKEKGRECLKELRKRATGVCGESVKGGRMVSPMNMKKFYRHSELPPPLPKSYDVWLYLQSNFFRLLDLLNRQLKKSRAV